MGLCGFLLTSLVASASSAAIRGVSHGLFDLKESVASPLEDLSTGYYEMLTLKDALVKVQSDYLTLSSELAQHVVHAAKLTRRGIAESPYVKQLKEDIRRSDKTLELSVGATREAETRWSEKMTDLSTACSLLRKALSEADAIVQEMNTQPLVAIEIQEDLDEEVQLDGQATTAKAEEQRGDSLIAADHPAPDGKEATASAEAETKNVRRLMDSSSDSSDEDDEDSGEEPDTLPPPIAFPMIRVPIPVRVGLLPVVKRPTPTVPVAALPIYCPILHAASAKSAFCAAWESGTFSPADFATAVETFYAAGSMALAKQSVVSVQQELFDARLEEELKLLGFPREPSSRRLMMEPLEEEEEDDSPSSAESLEVPLTMIPVTTLSESSGSYRHPAQEPDMLLMSPSMARDTTAELRELIADWEVEMIQKQPVQREVPQKPLNELIDSRYEAFHELQVAHEDFFQAYTSLLSIGGEYFPELETTLSGLD